MARPGLTVRGIDVILAAMVLTQLLVTVSAAKRGTKQDDEAEDTTMDLVWAALKLTFAFSPFIGLFLFMFCTAFESKEKEKLKRAKKHGTSKRTMYQVPSSRDALIRVQGTKQCPALYAYGADFQMGDGTGD